MHFVIFIITTEAIACNHNASLWQKMFKPCIHEAANKFCFITVTIRTAANKKGNRSVYDTLFDEN